MLRVSPILTLIAATILGVTSRAQGAQQVLVVGDSLTKEYQVEFPILFPNNPPAWLARNWVELLHTHRNAHFDLGSVSTFLDPRVTGHKHNWAFPGSLATSTRSMLRPFASPRSSAPRPTANSSCTASRT